MGNICLGRTSETRAHVASSFYDDEASGDEISSQVSNFSDAHNSPRAVVMAKVRRKWINANLVAVNQLSAHGAADPLREARQTALGNVSKFHQAQLFGKTNEACLNQYKFVILPVEPRHTAALIAMPYHHKDPFDRLLIAQALVEGIPIVSADGAFDPYGVTRLW